MSVPAVSILAASLLASCQLPGSQRRVCVDPRQNVIDQRQCTTAGGIGRYYYYHGGSGFGTGSHISGGSFTSHGGSGGGAASSVGRGGFGGHSAGG